MQVVHCSHLRTGFMEIEITKRVQKDQKMAEHGSSGKEEEKLRAGAPTTYPMLLHVLGSKALTSWSLYANVKEHTQ